MALLIDTTVLIDAERQSLPLEGRFEIEKAAISVVTVSELLHGVHRAADERVRSRRAAFVEYILAALEPLPVTSAVARSHARIWADLERAGTPIGPHDMWIAATAVSHGMDVATANAEEFRRVSGLTVVEP